MNYIFVFIGGGFGSLLRYISTFSINTIYNNKFTLGTLFVNCIGSLLVGFLINFFAAYSLEHKWRLLIITGFLGGYTTFSAYAVETIQYIMNGNVKYAIANIVIHNILCLVLVVLGILINRILFAR